MKINPLLLAVVLLIPTVIVAVLLPKPQSLILLALLLVFIAAIYVGFALSDGRRKALLIQPVVALAFTIVAFLGVLLSPLLLALGYAAHGLWDGLHHRGWIDTQVVEWWPPFCVIYDFAVAGFIFFWWS